MSDSHYTLEQVPPWNGKKEDKLVFSFLVAVFVLATVLMKWLYPSEDVTPKKIPDEIRQHLTALSNAAEEIILLKEIAGQDPTLKELQEMNVAPFSEVTLNTMAQLYWNQSGQCFIGFGQLSAQSKLSANHFFQLLLSFESPSQINHSSSRYEHLASGNSHEDIRSELYTTSWRLLDADTIEQARNQTNTLNCQQILVQSNWH